MSRGKWKKNLKYGDIKVLLKKYGKLKGHFKGRYSGKTYENPKEKLLAIRDKYKNGIPDGTIEAMLGIESGG